MNNIKDTTVCNGSQTEVCSLINCATCTLSMDAVKMLVHVIDIESRKYGAFNTSVSKIRYVSIILFLIVNSWYYV